MSIEGRLPKDLRGTLYRNGPAVFARSGTRYRHWFDGDGMVQAFSFADGSVAHRGRVVQTPKWRAEQTAERFLAPAFGTATGDAAYPVTSADMVNTANTHVQPLAGQLFALWEGGSAIEMDPVTLETRGSKTWARELKGVAFSAHPKLAADGTLWNFGSVPGGLVIYQIDAGGELVRHALLNLGSRHHLGMIHDFVVSERHLVFVLPPYRMNVARMRVGVPFGQALEWQDGAPMQVVTVDKATLTIAGRYELPCGMVFHFGNAWEEPGGVIHFDFVLSESLRAMHEWMPGLMRGEQTPAGRSEPAFVTLVPGAARARIEVRVQQAEFPRVDPRVVGTRHRHLYLPTRHDGPAQGYGFNAITRLDLTREIEDTYVHPGEWSIEEHVVVPRRGSAREGDGWLIGTFFDARAGVSGVSVFDALDLAAGPLAIAHLPYWIPYGFHGNWSGSDSRLG